MNWSAGILLYRYKNQILEVFLVHPGGPYFRKKNDGWWTVPKGEVLGEETPIETALREFEEETGHVPEGDPVELKPIKQKGGKTVACWAIPGDLDPDELRSNTFEIEWPPRSGKRQAFPEIDQGAWYNLSEASEKINVMQRAFLEELQHRLDAKNK
jgi:predicted NUDIX family NTP pyrophosphohydrolase